MTTRQEVDEFLRAFKAAMTLGHFAVLDRRKNIQALIDLGITSNQRKDILESLDVVNYYRGPSADDWHPEEEVWEFGYDLDRTEIYIKLRLVSIEGRKTVSQAQVWSFHKAEFPIQYPFR